MIKSNTAIQAATLILMVVMSYFLVKMREDLGELRSTANPLSIESAGYGLPADIEGEIQAVETQLIDPQTWPNDTTAWLKLSDQIASIADQLTQSVDEKVWRRLFILRWNVDAIRIILDAKTAPIDVKNLSGVASTLDASLSDMPEGVSSQILTALKLVKDKLPDQLREAAIRDARNAIANAEKAVGENAVVGNDFESNAIETAAEYLGRYTAEGDKEAPSLLKQLHGISAKRSIKTSFLVLDADYESFEKISKRPSDLTLREYAMSRLNQNLLSLHLRVHSAGLGNDADISKKLTAMEEKKTRASDEIRNQALKVQAKQSRDYQIWALNQIQAVQYLSWYEKSELQKIVSTVSRKNPLSVERENALLAAQNRLKDDMAKYLAPINQGLLDEAVSQWFRKVYANRYEALKDPQQQWEVVKAFAITVKHSPGMVFP